MNNQQEIFSQAARNYLVCYSTACPLSDRCLHYDVGQAARPELRAVTAVNPRYAHANDGQCDFFRDHTPITMPVGMRQHFFTDMPARIATAIKKRLIARNCRTTFYRYFNGQRPIAPLMQQFIEQVCREEGWTGPLVYDGETVDFDW